MLLIEANDQGGRPVRLVLSTKRIGKAAETTLNLFRVIPQGGPLSGELIGGIVLNKDDAAELKRNL